MIENASVKATEVHKPNMEKCIDWLARRNDKIAECKKGIK
jgi:hypothetical protein